MLARPLKKIPQKPDRAFEACGAQDPCDAFGAVILPLLIMTFIFFLNFMSRIIFAPLLPVIEQDLDIHHVQAGSLFLFITSGYFISLMGSGFVSSRLTHRNAIILSAFVLGLIQMGVSFCESLWAIRSGVFFIGLMAGIYLPSGIATLTALVNPGHWGKAVAIHELAPNLGFVVIPLIAEALLAWFPWRGVVAAAGLLTLLSGAAFYRFGRGGHFRGAPPTLSAIRTLIREPGFWIMLCLFSLAISSTLGIYTMLSLYLVAERGMDQTLANTLIACSRILGVGASFIAGWAADRLGIRKTVITVFLITGLLTVLLGPVPDAVLYVVFFLQPTIAVCFFPAGFAALSSLGPPEIRSVAVSFTIPFAFTIGSGVVPTLIGVMGDRGSFGIGISVLGLFIMGGALLARALKVTVRQAR